MRSREHTSTVGPPFRAGEDDEGERRNGEHTKGVPSPATGLDPKRFRKICGPATATANAREVAPRKIRNSTNRRPLRPDPVRSLKLTRPRRLGTQRVSRPVHPGDGSHHPEGACELTDAAKSLQKHATEPECDEPQHERSGTANDSVASARSPVGQRHHQRAVDRGD